MATRTIRTTMGGNNDIVRLVIISDTHGLHETLQMPPGDVLIHCGDMAFKGNVEDVRDCIQWLNSLLETSTSLSAQDDDNDNQTKKKKKKKNQYQQILVIDGNHDRTVAGKMAPGGQEWNVREEFDQLALDRNSDGHGVQLLQDEAVVLDCQPHHPDDDHNNNERKLCIYGASWQSCDKDDFSGVYQWKQQQQPPIDILLTHIHASLPKNQIPPHLNPDAWKGSSALTRAVLHHRIPLCCFGHIHWGRGHVPLQRRSGLVSHFINAASATPGGGTGVSAPVVVDYNLVTKQVEQVECAAHYA